MSSSEESWLHLHISQGEDCSDCLTLTSPPSMEPVARTGLLEACVGGTHLCSRWFNKNREHSTPGGPGDLRVSSRGQVSSSKPLPVSLQACCGPAHCCGCLASCVMLCPGIDTLVAAKASGGLEITSHVLFKCIS